MKNTKLTLVACERDGSHHCRRCVFSDTACPVYGVSGILCCEVDEKGEDYPNTMFFVRKEEK